MIINYRTYIAQESIEMETKVSKKNRGGTNRAPQNKKRKEKTEHLEALIGYIKESYSLFLAQKLRYTISIISNYPCYQYPTMTIFCCYFSIRGTRNTSYPQKPFFTSYCDCKVPTKFKGMLHITVIKPMILHGSEYSTLKGQDKKKMG